MSLKEKLYQSLVKNGHSDVAKALQEDKTNDLSNDQQNTLITYTNNIKNGRHFVAVQPIAGFSESSGSSGFLSGNRAGFGTEEPA